MGFLPVNEAMIRRPNVYMAVYNNRNPVTGSDPVRTTTGASQDQNPQMAPLALGSQSAGTTFPGMGGVFSGNAVLTRDTDALHWMDSVD